MSLFGRLKRSLDSFGPRRRRVWIGAKRAHVELRALDAVELVDLRKALAREVARHPRIEQCEVSVQTARVVLTFQPPAPSEQQLVQLVESAEHAARVAHRPYADGTVGHPSDVEPLERIATAVAVDAAALVAGFALRAAFVPASGLAANAAAVLAVGRAIPRVRAAVDARFGAERAEQWLDVADGVLQGMAQRPLANLVSIAQRQAQLGELGARREVWERREAELFRDRPIAPDADQTPLQRPVVVPPGPIEEYADRAWVVSLVGFGVSMLATRNLERSVSALFGALPRPARLGREVFASMLGRSLAARGVLVLRPEALRLLDRLDCLVVDARLVSRQKFELGTVVAPGLEEARARALVMRAFDADRSTELVREDDLIVGPVGALPVALAGELADRARALAVRGALVLGVARGRELLAVAEVRVLPRTGAEELIAAARKASMVVLIAGENATLLEGADEALASADVAATVHRLQREGRVVAMVSGVECAALAAADVGIALVRPGQPVPWGAHLLCHEDLPEARYIVAAAAVARDVAKQSVNTALVAAGLGTLVAAAGLVPMTTRRALSMVNAAALISMGNGARQAYELDRRPLPLPRDRTPWHALDAEGVLRRLGSRVDGLGAQELALRPPVPQREQSAVLALADAVSDELFSPLAPMLAAGAALSGAVGSVNDAALVGGVVVVNAAVGGVQRFLAERRVRELSRVRRSALVVREGATRTIDAALLVVGDVVELHAGDVVPADCRIIEARSLEVDASSLTGESVPVKKSAEPSFEAAISERTSMLFEGTTIAAGRARAVVVAVGDATESRRVLGAGPPERRQSGVDVRLRELVERTGPLAAGAGLGLLGVGLLRGRKLSDVIGSAVSLAVASVPEGLPLLVTGAQLGAAQRLAKVGVVVRDPRAIEVLGRVELLCLDKTGTLTEGGVELALVGDAAADWRVDSTPLPASARAVLTAALRASSTAPADLRDPVDAALDRAARSLRVERETAAPLAELPFEVHRGFHASLHAAPDGRRVSLKGAPERVLPRCTTFRGVPLTDEDRTRVAAHVAQLAKQGLRVLAVAEQSASALTDLTAQGLVGLDLLGVVAFSDPVRAGAADAIARLKRAGVRTLILTGDHPETALAVAREVGLHGEARVALTGADLLRLTDGELETILPDVSVIARLTPAQKLRIIRTLQRSGRCVGMVGDGANDAPALRAADVGIAFGESGVEAARQSAPVVVPGGQLGTLVEAVVEGRATWASVRDAVSILVGGNLGEVAFTVAGSLVDGRSPLSPRQLLLVNLLTDVAPAMAVALKPPSQAVRDSLTVEGPDAALGWALDRDIGVRAGATALGAGVAWGIARATGPADRARSVGLVALVGTQLGQTLASGGATPAVVVTGLVSAGVLAAIVQIPGLSGTFGCRPLGPIGWATALGSSVAATALAQTAPELVESWLRRTLAQAQDGRLLNTSR